MTDELFPPPDQEAREYIARQLSYAGAIKRSYGSASAKIAALATIRELLIARTHFTAANQIAKLIRVIRAG